MYSTLKIEKIIKSKYLSKLSKYMNCDLNSLLNKNIFYCKGGYNCMEGLYIWTDEASYNYMYVEKGRPQKHIKTNDFFDIVYIVLSEYVWGIAMDYAINHVTKDKDFRRALFDKEIELWSVLDKRGELKYSEYIENVLKEHPYVDE